MTTYIVTPFRALLLAVALLFAGQTADAGRTSEPTPSATARTTARAKADAADEADDGPLGGVLIIAGIVGVVILLAWIGSRIGDNRSHVIN